MADAPSGPSRSGGCARPASASSKGRTSGQPSPALRPTRNDTAASSSRRIAKPSAAAEAPSIHCASSIAASTGPVSASARSAPSVAAAIVCASGPGLSGLLVEQRDLERTPLRTGQRRDRLLEVVAEQIAQHRERELRLGTRRPRLEHVQAPVACLAHGGGPELRLADPGFAHDDEDSRACGRIVDEGADRGQLGLALQEPRRPRRPNVREPGDADIDPLYGEPRRPPSADALYGSSNQNRPTVPGPACVPTTAPSDVATSICAFGRTRSTSSTSACIRSRAAACAIPTRNEGASVEPASSSEPNSANAFALPPTRLNGTTSPSRIVRIGFTFSSPPTSDDARPIRPPRAR